MRLNDWGKRNSIVLGKGRFGGFVLGLLGLD